MWPLRAKRLIYRFLQRQNKSAVTRSPDADLERCLNTAVYRSPQPHHFQCVLGEEGREGRRLFMPPFIHLLERGTLSNRFLKSKVNVLTAKLKTCFGSGWGCEGRVLGGGKVVLPQWWEGGGGERRRRPGPGRQCG